jgi:AcrR family transcriptional regulator
MQKESRKFMGVSERRQREKKNLRKRILDEARKIIVAEGFDALTIRRVADAVEYAPGTLYLYFENRDAIARELCLGVYQAMYDALVPVTKIKNVQKRMRAFLQGYVAFALSAPEMYRLAFMFDPKFSDALLQNGPIEGADGPGQQIFAFLMSTIAELKQDDAEAFALAEMVWSAVHGIASLKIACHAYPVTSTETLVSMLADTVLAGIQQR